MKKYYILLILSGISIELSAGNPEANISKQDSIQYGNHTVVCGNSAYSYAQEKGSAIFDKSPHYDVAKALYGQLPGLVVYQGSGSSSDNISTLSIHGQRPLILIDGYPREISEITSSEIESITVLKDAAAAAIYGIQGANGVVLITTKRGTVSKLQVVAKYQYGLSTKFREPDFADGYTYANKLNEALTLDGLAPRYNELELDAFKTGRYKYYYPNVDWMSEAYRDVASNHRASLTFSGGDKRFRYFSAIDYMADQALYRNQSKDNRYNSDHTDTRLGARANIDVDITPTTFMSLGVMARLSESNRANSTSINSVLYRTPSGAFPIRNEDGSYGGSAIYGANNPVALLNDVGAYKMSRTTVLADINLKQDLGKLVKGLSADASLGFDYVGGMTDVSKKEYRYGEVIPTILEDGTLITEFIGYGKNSKTLDHDSWFQNLVMRTELQAKLNYELNLHGHKVEAHAFYKQQAYAISGRNNSQKRQSVGATVNYSYDDRYIVDLVANYSGTAYLPTDNRFTLYPAVSVGWVASNEKFLQNADFLSYLKVFGSVGKSGNDGNLQHELYLQSYGGQNAGDYFFTKNAVAYWGQAEGDLPSVNLMAELSKRVTAGVELRFLDDRLALFGDWFKERRSSILVESAKVSGIIGIGVGVQSSGIQEYSGIDFSASWSDKKGKFSYGLYANGSYLTSKIIENGQAFQQYDYLYQKGNPVGQAYGLEVVGIFQNQYQINNSPRQTFGDVRPGDLMYKDQNGDNKIDDEDKVKMYGSSIPRFHFGFGLNVGYGNFELSADFQGSTGVTVNLLSSPLYKPMSENGTISNTFLEHEVTWSPENKDRATMPRLTTLKNNNNYRNSSLWYRDGSFIKLRNLTLSYTLRRKVIRFADLKLYVQATDLFSLDNITFADPEQLWADYPSTRSFWIGAKFSF